MSRHAKMQVELTEWAYLVPQTLLTYKAWVSAQSPNSHIATDQHQLCVFELPVALPLTTPPLDPSNHILPRGVQ